MSLMVTWGGESQWRTATHRPKVSDMCGNNMLLCCVIAKVPGLEIRQGGDASARGEE